MEEFTASRRPFDLVEASNKLDSRKASRVSNCNHLHLVINYVING